MRRLGIILISASFLAAAYLAVLDPVTLDWRLFLAVLAGGAAGVFILRRATRTEASATDRLAANTSAMKESLERVISGVRALSEELPEMDVYDLPDTIDDRLLDDLNVFAGNRDSLKHAFGLEAFAEIMAPYAGGERYLNRVWSAAADGYIDEATAYLPRALEQFEEAGERLSHWASAPREADGTRGW